MLGGDDPFHRVCRFARDVRGADQNVLAAAAAHAGDVAAVGALLCEIVCHCPRPSPGAPLRSSAFYQPQARFRQREVGAEATILHPGGQPDREARAAAGLAAERRPTRPSSAPGS